MSRRAERYSGFVRVALSHDDAANRYRASISGLGYSRKGGHRYRLQTRQIVNGPSTTLEHARSPEAFDEAARAAIAVAIAEDKIDPDDVRWGSGDRVEVSRRRPLPSELDYGKLQRTIDRARQSHPCRCDAYPFPHKISGGACLC